MKKIILLMAYIVIALSATSTGVSVCKIAPDENGHFDCPYITRGTITWDKESHTLTLDNAVVEYYTDDQYDFVYPIWLTDDEATIVIHGECKLITNGFVALSFDSNNSKHVTLKGDGSLQTSSDWIDIFVKETDLTIKNITLDIANSIADNGTGVGVGITFNNVKADIRGEVARIGEGITFKNCAITYPADAYIANSEYGYYIACGDDEMPDHIVISRSDNAQVDVNDDGEVNIMDVDCIIGAILKGNNDIDYDVNSDTEVNILDVDVVIGIILGIYDTSPHKWVDLGLPSGTLWATCNIGANSPEEYGDYFAWGETAPRESYTWGNYKWFTLYDDSTFEVMKYCTDKDYGTVDGKTELDLEDDAAYVNWGASWRMPTLEQMIELLRNCSQRWTTQNGMKGYLLTGPNGNSLFFPAAGYRWGDSLTNPNTVGRYWSRTLCSDDPALAYTVEFANWGLSTIDTFEDIRCYAYSVRAVRAKQN